MYSKKVKEETSVATSSQTRRVTVTTTTTSRTIVQQQLSRPLNRSGNNALPPLPRPFSEYSLQPTGFPALEASKSSSNLINKPSYDAKPINLNYQSPYQRNSPVYSSYQPKKSSEIVLKPVPKTAFEPPLPATKIPSSLEPTKKLTVKKTGKFYDNNTLVPTYSTHSKNRGEVLVINNVMFKGHSERHGAKEDDKNLKTVFKQMGFNVTIERDLKTTSMKTKIEKFSTKSSLKSSDIAVVVIMSHGTKNTSIGGTEVFGIDEEAVHVDDLIECFNDANCKHMVNKPKIFIFQCCRGDNEQFVHTDAQRTPVAKAAVTDALIAYSTLPGFVSHRDAETGTWYIRTLCEVLSQHAHEYHVEDLLKMVEVKLQTINNNTRQTTHYENRGFKRCFLHPV